MGILRLEVGMSSKEVSQVFFALVNEGEGSVTDSQVSMKALVRLLDEGAREPLRSWAEQCFRSVGWVLLRTTAEEYFRIYAPNGGDALPYEAFTRLVASFDPSASPHQLLCLWCALEKRTVCNENGHSCAV